MQYGESLNVLIHHANIDIMWHWFPGATYLYETCNIMWHHVRSYDIMWDHEIMWCHEIMWDHVMSCEIIWHHVRPVLQSLVTIECFVSVESVYRFEQTTLCGKGHQCKVQANEIALQACNHSWIPDSCMKHIWAPPSLTVQRSRLF